MTTYFSTPDIYHISKMLRGSYGIRDYVNNSSSSIRREHEQEKSVRNLCVQRYYYNNNCINVARQELQHNNK